MPAAKKSPRVITNRQRAGNALLLGVPLDQRLRAAILHTSGGKLIVEPLREPEPRHFEVHFLGAFKSDFHILDDVFDEKRQ